MRLKINRIHTLLNKTKKKKYQHYTTHLFRKERKIAKIVYVILLEMCTPTIRIPPCDTFCTYIFSF